MTSPRSALRPVLGALVACAMFACGGPPPVKQDPVPTPDAGTDSPPAKSTKVDLRADVNRNGIVELDVASEDATEESWDANAGAIFLANIDDDTVRCPRTSTLTDVQLASCNDAQDDEVNGEEDLADMATLLVAPRTADDGAIATLTVSEKAGEKVRLFKKESDGTWSFYSSGGDISSEQLQAGVEFKLEGRDVVRDLAVWDGYADITLTVMSGDGTEILGEDKVRLRVSPVMTFHHLLSARQSYANKFEGDPASEEFYADLLAAVQLAGLPLGHKDLPSQDPWTQDIFETGFMSMPAADGKQKAITIAYRAPSKWDSTSATQLRRAGRAIFTTLRGKDFGAVQEFDVNANPNFDSLNSTGNYETVPPYSHNGTNYPMGRTMIGSTSTYYPDKKFIKLVEAQQQQPPIYLDTEWLLVGHVDETLSFLTANNPRGWVLLANDARLAKTMLEDESLAGNGNIDMFVGKYTYSGNNFVRADISINEVLGDPDLMAASAEAAVEVDGQVAELKEETGLTDAEIIPVPFLHYEEQGFSVAYQPGTVNGIVFNDKHYAAPDPHGPFIEGRDIFKAQLESQLEPLGYNVHWVEDFEMYHINLGEIHCGSNTIREIPEARWWESGR